MTINPKTSLSARFSETGELPKSIYVIKASAGKSYDLGLSSNLIC